MNYLAAYAATALVFLAMDAVWLGLIALGFYQRSIGHLMAPEFNLVAAGLFYVMFPAALVFFAVLPATSASWGKAALLGGLLGLTAYGTYDLTNLATLRDWPASLSLVDAAWGSLASAVAAVAGRAAWLAVAR